MLLGTDLFIVERGGVQYQMNSDLLKVFLQSNYITADITARDGLSLDVGDEVYVVDASADATVSAGGAKYIYDGTNFIKTAEDESMDVVIAPTDLSYTASPTGGLIENTSGSGAPIPIVDATNSGLATPQMINDSHVKAFAALTPATNPVLVNSLNQEIGFSISGLNPLP